MKITTDIHGLARVAPPGTIVAEYSASNCPSRWKRNFRLLGSALGSDHLAIHFDLTEVFFFTFLLWLIPFHHCKLTTLDFFIGEPKGLRRALLRRALSRIDRLLVYFKDSAAFEREYGVPAGKFHYVPFKINAWEQVVSIPATDDGYIFSGGRSRRDFATFFAAVGELGYPVKMVIGERAQLGPNGSTLNGVSVPPNVELIDREASGEFYVRMQAAAKFVVIPIVKGSTTQAGIGSYLQAMAARKCLIVSTGPGISDVLDPRDAMIVPAGDVKALREAIRTAWEDAGVREGFAERGYRYAAPLEGEDKLRESILHGLPG